jgi:hypothetical protein
LGTFGYKPLNMKIPALIVACLFSITAFAQTKLISFRSHSGSNANFRTAVEHDLYDLPNSNFGYPLVTQIDTIIRVSNDRIVVLKKSYYQGSHGGPQYFSRETLTKAKASELFAATNMQSLKAAVKKKYDWAEVDSTLYIGFDKKFKSGNTGHKK